MAQEATQAVLANEQADQRDKRIRTVIVDDSDLMLDCVCTLLELDHRIEIVGRGTNGLEALERVAATQPDLVLMDVNMPIMDGVQTARMLAEHFPETKVILMSAIDSPKVREQCRAVGVDGFARKINFREEFAIALGTILS